MISIILGSKSDFDVIKAGLDICNKYEVPHEVRVFSAHRSSQGLLDYVNKTDSKVFIAVAGGAAHLAGVIAAHTIKPVIGVPVETRIGGLDSLLSTAQMPAGVPVATMAVNGFTNAIILAMQILGLADKKMQAYLLAYKQHLIHKVEAQDAEIKELVGK